MYNFQVIISNQFYQFLFSVISCLSTIYKSAKYFLTEAVAQRCYVKEKHVSLSLFLKKLQGFRPITLLNGDSAQVLPSEFCKIFKNT